MTNQPAQHKPIYDSRVEVWVCPDCNFVTTIEAEAEDHPTNQPVPTIPCPTCKSFSPGFRNRVGNILCNDPFHGSGKVSEPCPTCGATNFPVWNDKGECITCARDRVLGVSEPTMTKESNTELLHMIEGSEPTKCETCHGGGYTCFNEYHKTPDDPDCEKCPVCLGHIPQPEGGTQ